MVETKHRLHSNLLGISEHPFCYTIPPKETIPSLSFYLMVILEVFSQYIHMKPPLPLRYETQDLVIRSQIDGTILSWLKLFGNNSTRFGILSRI
ncbi:hypothetical protein C1645_817486 [Glomus cerebriforme]|uniref:Uncharacterized protein n=1 Tax=Glomus cerebriforme TaxID=658196 RepID=A0A397TBS0_9GLOM|nr:hypothetical protein C1645_817486 [Glomus cerebriforme]